MKIYLYSTQNAHGIKVITDNLIRAFERKQIAAELIRTLDERSNEDIIIPYGVKDSLDLIKRGLSCKVVFAADAITLGYKNKIIHYAKFKRIFTYDFWYSVYGFCRYRMAERRMLKNYEKSILVSPTDIEYFHKEYDVSYDKMIYATNGIDLIDSVKNKRNTVGLILGILATWYSDQIIEESKWFIDEIFSPFVSVSENSDIKLVLAGRGPAIKQFEGRPNIEVIGEVNSLNDFFSSIDIMISSNPKGCGILNRVLDSFAHKVPVCGVSQSFSGFPNSNGCYLEFSDLKDFSLLIENLRSNREMLEKISENAYEYIRKFHDWELIYDELTEKLIKILM